MTKIVNCFRGPKLIGSFVINLAGRTSQESDFLDIAKNKLLDQGLAVKPFDNVDFVIRDRYGSFS